MGEKSPLFNRLELTALAVCGSLVALHVLFWRQLRGHPAISLALLGGILAVAGGVWVYRNYRLVAVRAKRVKAIEEKLEGIVYSLFFPRGYDLLEPLRVDQQDIGWASLRDSGGIPVSLEYLDVEMNRAVGGEQVRRLLERMNVNNAPKGICLTTGSFDQEALELAKRSNVLTRDGQQLVEMVKRAEAEAAGAQEHLCPHCSSKLIESSEIIGLWRCPNPNCRKEFKVEDLESSEEGAGHKGPRNVKAFTISCYGCGRPVELDTTMSGLMECPYDDCSWIINVDNELLALRGGLDKRVSERLTEIKCPRCERMIKVPADAEGLMECPCEEKWIIDVGAALGERAQAQIAEGSPEVEAESRAPVIRSVQAVDYPHPVAGNPAPAFAPAPAPPAVELPVEPESGRRIDRALIRAQRIIILRKQQEAARSAPTQTAPMFELVREPGAVFSAAASAAAAGMSPPAVPEPPLSTPEAPVLEIQAHPAAEPSLVDCPGCGAGVPGDLAACPVCGAALHPAVEEALPAAEATLSVDTPPPVAQPEVTHRRTFFALSTPALIFFFVFSVAAFLLFVYFIAR
ncbi:restriction endonuclease [bacterium]|nr:restriction endonuclease [bacterium]